MNFKRDQDNICNLAINYKLMTDEYCKDAISEESKTDARSSARYPDQTPALGENSVPDHEIKNYLTNTTVENTKRMGPSGQPTSRGQGLPEQSLNLLGLEPTTNNGLEDITSDEAKDQPPVSLENLYDLDTSRFDEEFMNLPTSKKKRILDQMDQQSPVRESAVALQILNQSEQASNLVDVSRFNVSHEMHRMYHESYRKLPSGSELSGLGALKDKSQTKAPVVAINLAPILRDSKKN